MQQESWWFQNTASRQHSFIVFFLERQSMLKVVFVLRQIILRLKQCEIEIVVKKQKDSVLLGSHCRIIDGICNINQTTQFYLSPSDSALNIQVLILQANSRKLGGNTVVNLAEWQPNVLHESISVLTSCPDKQARIFYNFYYFKEHSIADKRHIFLSSNRFRDQCENIQKKNILLTEENRALEKALNQEERRNETLITMKEQKQLDLIEREKVFSQKMGCRQKNIEIYQEQYEVSQEMGEQLQGLAKEKGFTLNEND